MKPPTVNCGHCRLPERVYTRGRHRGLVRRHWHPFITGWCFCPGSRRAPLGGAK